MSSRALVWTYFSFLIAGAGATLLFLGTALLHYLPHNVLNKIGLDCAPSSGCATLPIWLASTISLLVGGALLGLLVVASLALVSGLAGSRRLSSRIARASRPLVDLVPAHLRSVTCIIEDPAPLSYTLGALRARIVVSEGLLEALEPEEVQAVLAHEEGHLLAHDGLLILIGQTIASSMAVVPGMRLAFARMRRAQELAADEYATAAVGDALVVASSLQKFARSLVSPPAPAPAFVQEGGVAERIQELLKDWVTKTGTSRRRLALAIGLSFVVLASFSTSAMAYTGVTRASGQPCSACTHSSAHRVAAQHPSPHPDCAVDH